MKRFFQRLQERLEQAMTAVAFAEEGEGETARLLMKEPVGEPAPPRASREPDSAPVGIRRPESA